MTKARDLANIISDGFTADDIPNLDTAKITTGTFADARMPSTVLNSNVDLTNLSATNLTSGTLPDARFPATLPAVSGASLTNLPGGDFVKLATTTVSSDVSSISFDGLFSSTYSHYQFIGTGLVHNEAWNSSNNGMRMRIRQSDSDVTGSSYAWVMNDATINHSGGKSHAAEGAYGASTIQITRHQTTGNNYQTSFIVDVHNPLDTAKYKSINWSSSHIYLHDGNTGNRYFHSCPGSAVYRSNTSAYSGVTFFAASGDITAGSISVYGTKL